MLKTILSIDMDFLMEPSIALYDDLSTTLPRDLIWNTIREIRRAEPYLNYNEDYYTNLLGLIVKVLKGNKNIKIKFANNHDSILDLIQNSMSDGDKVSVVNLDNHHDIYYEEYSINEIANNISTVATWVGYLYSNDLLNDYTWVNTKASQPYLGAPMDIMFKSVNAEQYFILNDKFDYDMLFICLSPQWFPPKFDNLFYNILEIVKAYTDTSYEVDETNFCEHKNPRKLDLK